MSARALTWRLFSSLRRYRTDRRGAAAAEFALVLTFLTLPLASIMDVGIYVWDGMQLNNAAQVAVQTAWATCSSSANLPATPNGDANCPALPAAVTAAVHSTSLGTNVAVTATTENYYCVNTSTSALVTVGTFPGTKPANCGSVGSTTDTPGDYILITTSFTYSPLFASISVANLLTTPITRTARMRLS